uniref:histone chaperone RTT106-like n=1 Tax=Erigeron canadensis TaxID=72917 RepID=UPI001CB8B62B|nr:histone chaperone RTT106-like [Erigeron canadensis]
MAYFPGILPFGDRKSSSSLVFEEFVPPSAWTEDQTCHCLLVDLPGFKRQELKLQVDNHNRIVVSGERQVSENKYKRFDQNFELPNNADIEKITGKLESEILYITVPKRVEQDHQEIKHGSIRDGEKGTFAPAPAPSPSPHPESEVDEDANEDDSDDDNDDDDDKDDDDNKKSDAYANAEEKESESENKYGGGKEVERVKHESNSDEDWGKDMDLFLRVAIEKLRKNKRIVVTAIFAFSLGVLVTQKFQSNEN